MLIYPIKTSIFSVGQPLLPFLEAWLPAELPEKSVVCVTSKIIALSQNRVRDLAHDKDALIASEAERFFPIIPGLALTYKQGHWCPNAGVDASNAFGRYVLWPERPMEVAEEVRGWLQKKYMRQEIGVVVSDSRIFPARNGVTAVALGYAGFRALKDYRGQPDLAERIMEFTIVNVADGLATAAALTMGEGNESQPLAIMQDVPVEFVSEPLQEPLVIDAKMDLFGPLMNP